MTHQTSKAGYTLRALTGDDLRDVVRIDWKVSGQRRRGFYERRLAAALKDPKEFIYLGACAGDRLAGYAIARILGGEFGSDASTASLDAIGVDPDHQGRGVGRKLMVGLEEIMRHKGIDEVHSETEWTNHNLLAFFDAAGFATAPRVVLGRNVATPLTH